MSHPYANKSQDKAGHSRAKAITSGYARGGRAPSKVNVNIHLPPHGSDQPVSPPLPPAPALGSPAAPMGVPPVPPGGGGPLGRARGGKVMTAGADSGVGRLEKSGIGKRGKD